LSRSIAFFDFDGTITTKDTLLELIKYQKGEIAFYVGLLILSPVIIAYKLGFYSNWKAKQSVLRYFFKGTPFKYFQSKCDNFSLTIIPKLLRPKAIETINYLKQKNVRIIIVTASAENWVKAWCNSINVEYLATCLEIKENKITGNIAGKNCYGPEKADRIRNYIDLEKYDKIYAFGDSKGDYDMLKLGEQTYYKPFGSTWLTPHIMIK
jgi:HAD superfamily hydrolase (TIGR01490 family)